MARPKLKVEKREVFGRKVKKLREEGLLPANMYGKDIKSQALKTDTSEFKKVFRKTGETGLVDLVIGKKETPVLVQNVQRDPVTDVPLHADFYQVNLKEKVAAQIPVELVGESPAEKEGLGTAVQYISEIEVEALPTDLPENFEIDISKLKEVDQAIHIKDMDVDEKKVEIQNEEDQIVVKVEPPREEEEEPAPVADEGESVEGEEEEAGESEPSEGEEDKQEGTEEEKEDKQE